MEKTAKPASTPRQLAADLLVGLPCGVVRCPSRAAYGIHCKWALGELKRVKEVIILGEDTAAQEHYHLVCEAHRDEFGGPPVPLSDIIHLPVEWWD